MKTLREVRFWECSGNETLLIVQALIQCLSETPTETKSLTALPTSQASNASMDQHMRSPVSLSGTPSGKSQKLLQ